MVQETSLKKVFSKVSGAITLCRKIPLQYQPVLLSETANKPSFTSWTPLSGASILLFHCWDWDITPAAISWTYIQQGGRTAEEQWTNLVSYC